MIVITQQLQLLHLPTLTLPLPLYLFSTPHLNYYPLFIPLTITFISTSKIYPQILTPQDNVLTSASVLRGSETFLWDLDLCLEWVLAESPRVCLGVESWASPLSERRSVGISSDSKDPDDSLPRLWRDDLSRKWAAHMTRKIMCSTKSLLESIYLDMTQIL